MNSPLSRRTAPFTTSRPYLPTTSLTSMLLIGLHICQYHTNILLTFSNFIRHRNKPSHNFIIFILSFIPFLLIRAYAHTHARSFIYLLSFICTIPDPHHPCLFTTAHARGQTTTAPPPCPYCFLQFSHSLPSITCSTLQYNTPFQMCFTYGLKDHLHL